METFSHEWFGIRLVLTQAKDNPEMAYQLVASALFTDLC